MLSDCSCYHARDSLPSAASSSSSIISNSVFEMIRQICMIWTKNIFDICIIMRSRISVTNKHCNRVSGSFSFKHSRQNLKFMVFFLSCWRDVGLSGFSSFKLQFDIVSIYNKTSWHTINHDSQCRTVRLSKRCHTKQSSMCIHDHNNLLKIIYFVRNNTYMCID